MARRKSFLPRLEIDVAGASHNCQHDKTHRIHKGDRRLKVTEGRDVEHFCISCALDSLSKDVETLQALTLNLKS